MEPKTFVCKLQNQTVLKKPHCAGVGIKNENSECNDVLNLRADGQGPASVIQAARSPDLIVHHLGAQVSTLTNKQAVLDFLL